MWQGVWEGLIPFDILANFFELGNWTALQDFVPSDRRETEKNMRNMRDSGKQKKIFHFWKTVANNNTYLLLGCSSPYLRYTEEYTEIYWDILRYSCGSNCE